MSQISVPVAYGELIDKITILEIKSERMRDAAKLANVRVELDLLNETWYADPASRIDIAAERGIKIGRWRELTREEVEALRGGRNTHSDSHHAFNTNARFRFQPSDLRYSSR